MSSTGGSIALGDLVGKLTMLEIACSRPYFAASDLGKVFFTKLLCRVRLPVAPNLPTPVERGLLPLDGSMQGADWRRLAAVR